MKSTGNKARRGMTRFVAIIFITAVVIATAYYFVFTPGSA
ncbi:hypothetical protein GGQ67_004223 [Rhizobium metallidurans]|uniref:Uncharacterized protein n=1 Tax=Rhizobium metallidurans TaxID=1265931 RepID=A0A7W6GEC0_9HYPH|nr:hypothetical protein [Rhizobium metallidurans]